jgi:hypothetical protein
MSLNQRATAEFSTYVHQVLLKPATYPSKQYDQVDCSRMADQLGFKKIPGVYLGSLYILIDGKRAHEFRNRRRRRRSRPPTVLSGPVTDKVLTRMVSIRIIDSTNTPI